MTKIAHLRSSVPTAAQRLAQWRKQCCEMKLKGGPASGMTVVMPLSPKGGLWFVYGGKVHHYRGIPGKGTWGNLVYVEPVGAVWPVEDCRSD